MAAELDPTGGVARRHGAHDPDLPNVIIDLSGREGRAPATPVAPLTLPPVTQPPLTLPPVAQPPVAEPPVAVAMPARPGPAVAVAGHTGPIVAGPATPPLAPGPATPDAESPTVVLGAARPRVVGRALVAATIRSTDVALRRAGRVVSRPVRVPRGPGRRPGQAAAVAAHRRRTSRSVLRAWEAAAWVAALGVIATVVVFVVRSAPPSAPFVVGAAPANAAVPPVGPSCFLTACATPLPLGPPTRVRIPAINVDSTLESLTLNARHELNPPVSYDRAGWYSGGILPGDPGPAVIAGHVDSFRGPGIFFKLHTLTPGAFVDVQRGGAWLSFRVTTIERYPKDAFPTDRVYRGTPDAELRLITCGGDFDTVHRRYDDNIVVFAVLARTGD